MPALAHRVEPRGVLQGAETRHLRARVYACGSWNVRSGQGRAAVCGLIAVRAVPHPAGCRASHRTRRGTYMLQQLDRQPLRPQRPGVNAAPRCGHSCPGRCHLEPSLARRRRPLLGSAGSVCGVVCVRVHVRVSAEASSQLHPWGPRNQASALPTQGGAAVQCPQALDGGSPPACNRSMRGRRSNRLAGCQVTHHFRLPLAEASQPTSAIIARAARLCRGLVDRVDQWKVAKLAATQSRRL